MEQWKRASAGYTLVEVAVMVGLVAIVTLGAGALTLSSRPAQVDAAARHFDQMLGAARALAAGSNGGATIFVTVDPDGTSHARLYKNHPGWAQPMEPAMVPPLDAGVAITEPTLRAPFAIIVHANGVIGMRSGYSFGDAVNGGESGCPPAGSWTFRFAWRQEAETRQLPCTIDIADTGAPMYLPTPAPSPAPTGGSTCAAGFAAAAGGCSQTPPPSLTAAPCPTGFVLDASGIACDAIPTPTSAPTPSANPFPSVGPSAAPVTYTLIVNPLALGPVNAHTATGSFTASSNGSDGSHGLVQISNPHGDPGACGSWGQALGAYFPSGTAFTGIAGGSSLHCYIDVSDDKGSPVQTVDIQVFTGVGATPPPTPSYPIRIISSGPRNGAPIHIACDTGPGNGPVTKTWSGSVTYFGQTYATWNRVDEYTCIGTPRTSPGYANVSDSLAMSDPGPSGNGIDAYPSFLSDFSAALPAGTDCNSDADTCWNTIAGLSRQYPNGSPDPGGFYYQ